jgi:hypothetical protein
VKGIGIYKVLRVGVAVEEEVLQEEGVAQGKER